MTYKLQDAGLRLPSRYRIIEDHSPAFLRAQDQKLHRQVVIRSRLRKARGSSMRREATVLDRAARNNPFVPRVLDWWMDGEWEHLVLDYVAGTSLEDLMKAGRAQGKPYFAPEASHRMILGLIKGLIPLHRNSICHGDLKPANLIVSRHNNLVMIDFGSAWSGGTPMGGRDRGTEGYAAPEQWMEEGLVDERADQFSVSVIFYQMLTNDLPWDGLGGSIVQHLQGPIPPLTVPSRHESFRNRKTKIWPALDGVLQKALSIDKDARFETTKSWLQSFQQAGFSPQGQRKLTLASETRGFFSTLLDQFWFKRT